MPYNSDLSLLIVENDKATLDIFQNLISIRFSKMIIHTALNADEAITKYKEYKHDIVITDLFDPQKYGIKIAEEVCEINPHSVVIFITADTDAKLEKYKHKAERLCLEGIIHKPIDLAEALDKIKEAVGIVAKRVNKLH